jgi:predicted metal-dependent hydrolase
MSLVVRKMFFDIKDDMDMLFVKDDPECACYLNAISLTLPYLEPYFIRIFKEVLPTIQDAELKKSMQLFIKQEAQHYQQHQKYNEVVRKRYPEIEKYEMQFKDQIASFLEHKDLKFSVAYIEGFESLTSGMSVVALDGGMCSRAEGEAGDLFRWHFCEEVEHRTIAFDAYHELYNDYFYRIKMIAFVYSHISKFVINVMKVMLKQERQRLLLEYGGNKGKVKRLGRFMKSEYWRYLKATFVPFSPRYSPHKLKVPQHIFDMSDQYALSAEDILS